MDSAGLVSVYWMDCVELNWVDWTDGFNLFGLG